MNLPTGSKMINARIVCFFSNEIIMLNHRKIIYLFKWFVKCWPEVLNSCLKTSSKCEQLNQSELKFDIFGYNFSRKNSNGLQLSGTLLLRPLNLFLSSNFSLIDLLVFDIFAHETLRNKQILEVFAF